MALVVKWDFATIKKEPPVKFKVQWTRRETFDVFKNFKFFQKNSLLQRKLSKFLPKALSHYRKTSWGDIWCFWNFLYKRYSSTELPQKNLPVYTKITYFTGQLVSSSSIFPNESNDMLIESFLWKSEISSEWNTDGTKVFLGLQLKTEWLATKWVKNLKWLLPKN